MSRRYQTRRILEKAWRGVIKDYARQRINSERSLQASLWSRLNAILPSKTRRMFIEPGIRIGVKQVDGTLAREARFPDLVICNTKEVIAIIEVKYQPRALPTWRKDLETFKWLVKNRDLISISNFRFLGIARDVRKYPLAKDVLYVWAGIHREWSSSLAEYIDPELKDFFLELHADTTHLKKARVR